MFKNNLTVAACITLSIGLTLAVSNVAFTATVGQAFANDKIFVANDDKMRIYRKKTSDAGTDRIEKLRDSLC